MPYVLSDKNEQIVNQFWRLNNKKDLILKNIDDTTDLLEILDGF